MQVYSTKQQKLVEVNNPFITPEQAKEIGVSIGTQMHGCPNTGSNLPTYHPGSQTVTPHLHEMVDNGSRRCYISTKCNICGATYVCDSGD